jgi:hypothetical protein
MFPFRENLAAAASLLAARGAEICPIVAAASPVPSLSKNEVFALAKNNKRPYNMLA